MRRGVLVALCMALALSAPLAAAGCGGGAGGAIKEVELGEAQLRDGFALYYPVTASVAPAVPDYAVNMDLSNVAGVGAASLSREAARALATQGFFVLAGEGDSMEEVYAQALLPSFVSVDALMHVFSRMCAVALGDIEERYLAADLEALLLALHDTTLRMCEGSGGAVREAALGNAAFLGVAACLLGLEVSIPREVEDAVDEELSLIAAHSGVAPSPVLAYAHDYGIYDPRGRAGGAGEGYSRAMTWLGAGEFFLRPGTTPASIASGRDMTRRALLLVGALHASSWEGRPAHVLWDRIYHPTAFIAGQEADLDAADYTRLAREVFGDSFPLSRLGDDALLDDFIARAMAGRRPRISSLTGEGFRGEEAEASFRLFPQARRPEDHVFEQLTAPLVEERHMPRGPDLPAALGSERAFEILEQFYEEKDHEGYEGQMNALRKLFRGSDPQQLRSNSHWARLAALDELLKPYGKGYPEFMRSPAWRDRCIYAFLGSWAEMRREDVALSGMLDSPRPTREGAAGGQGYVEPCPEAFARLAAATDMMRRGLEERGLAAEPLRLRLEELHALLLSLMGMAEKELRGEALSAEEHEALAGFGETMRRLLSPGGEGEGWEGDPLPFAASVYSGGEYGETLQAACGRPAVYYVIVPLDGRPALAVGAGYTYYEFISPADSPLSSEAWRKRVESGTLPENPAWSSSFL